MNTSTKTLLSREQRRRAGRAMREQVPLEQHAEWSVPAHRRDPIEVLLEGDVNRLPDLVPVRYRRMVPSAFAFLRGALALMGADLATSPATGLRNQICGDAHLGNFGVFGTRERNLVFDVTDFDETLVGPWEWDVKRLATSVEVAARDHGLKSSARRLAVTGSVAAYRSRMCQLADLGPLDVWYDRVDVDVVLDIARQYRANDLRRQLSLDRVRQRTSLSALPKLTAVVNGRRQIVDDPPLIVHEPSVHTEQFNILASYAESLPPDHKLLLGRYSIADTVRKVVGVGSVGTRCYLTLLMDADGQSPIFLQLKEACGALLSAHVGGRLPDGHQGQRIVLGQRLMQAASDPFLGWTSHDGHEYYVRQFRDMKGSVDLAALTARDLASYAVVCGQTLARAHGRAGDPAAIAGYLGRSGRFDDAIRSFASVYADQTERDHAALVNAVRTGRVRVQSDAQEAQV